jgi:hypothetical protein
MPPIRICLGFSRSEQSFPTIATIPFVLDFAAELLDNCYLPIRLGLAAERRIDIAVGERSETHGIKKDRAGGREKDSLEHGSRSSPQHAARRSHCWLCIQHIATSKTFHPSIRSTSRSPPKTTLRIIQAARLPGVALRSPQAPCAHPWL